MNRINKYLKPIIFVLLVVVIFNSIQDITKPKFGSHQASESTFLEEEKNSVDVLFLGTSNMFHTINPIVLYEGTGITAFDWGSSSQSLNMTYMYLKEALKTQSPKVVCLEMLGCRDDFNNNLYEPGMRWGFTHFPNTLDKYKTVYQQLHKFDAEYLSYIFPLFRYKDRWKELGENDFRDKYTDKYWKGCNVSYATTEVQYTEAYNSDKDWKMPPSNIETLDKIKILCEKNKINLVLYKSPTPTLWKASYSKRVQEYAEKNNLPFIDYNVKRSELGINEKTDFMDAGHVNVSGSVKITRDIGNYLKANYTLEDHRANNENNSWDISIKEKQRNEENHSKLKAMDNLETYLTNLDAEDYIVMCTVSGEIGDIQKATLNRYFKYEDGFKENCIRVNGQNIFTEINQEYTWHETIEGHDYALECAVQKTEDKEIYVPQMYVDGKSYMTVSHGINLVVFDKQLGRVVSNVGFDADKNYEIVRQE